MLSYPYACILQIVGSLPDCGLSAGLVKELVPDATDRKARHRGGSRTS